MADLVTLANVKTYLGITDSTEDANLSALITQMSAAAESYCSRKFSSTSYVDYIDGGSKVLLTRYYPLVSVTSILDTYNDNAAVTLGDLDIDLVTGEIRISITSTDLNVLGLYWASGKRRWKATYYYGSSTVPEDVKRAVIMMVSDARAVKSSALASETIGDYSYTAREGIPDAITALLRPYKSWGV